MPKVILSFVDNKSKHTTRDIYFAEQADHAANLAYVGLIRAEWDALSLAHIDKAELVYIEHEDLVRPVGNVNMGVVAAFGVRNDEMLLSRVTIPAPRPEAVLADSDQLDRAQAQVAAVIARLEGGQIQEYRGATLANVEYAEEEGGDPGGK